MKNLLTQVGVNINDRLCTIGGDSSVGKTNMLIILASDLMNEGKKVLFVTDDSVKLLINRFKMIQEPKNSNSLIIAQHIRSKGTLKERIQTLIEGRIFDVIIIDYSDLNTRDEIQDVFSFLRSTGIPTFVSQQLKRKPVEEIIDLLPSAHVMQMSDYVISITKKRTNSFFDWIKYNLLSFWFKKPNTTIRVHKNRYGNTKSQDFHLDTAKLKIS